MRKFSRKASRGFTLIELVVVVAVIAILAALLIPTILGQAERARVARVSADVQQVIRAAARIRTDTGMDPANPTDGATCYETIANYTSAAGACGVTALCTDAAVIKDGKTCWSGPYLPSVPAADPWGNPVAIKVITGKVNVGSKGPDGKTTNVALFGGTADAAGTDVDDIVALY